MRREPILLSRQSLLFHNRICYATVYGGSNLKTAAKGEVTSSPPGGMFRRVLFVNSTDLVQAMSFSTAISKIFSAANACINCENGPAKQKRDRYSALAAPGEKEGGGERLRHKRCNL